MLEVKAENETSRFQLFNRVAVVFVTTIAIIIEFIIAIATIIIVTAKIVSILFCFITEIHDIVFKARVDHLPKLTLILWLIMKLANSLHPS